MSNKTFCYYGENRPLGLGCFPKNINLLNVINWNNKQPILDNKNRLAFGYVEYNQMLSFEDIYKYELTPANKLEYSKYMFFIQCKRNYIEVEKMMDRLSKYTIEELKESINMGDKYSLYYIMIQENKHI